MGDQESEKMKCEVFVSLPSNTPVVGCEINPSVRVQRLKTRVSLEVPPYSLSFTWCREQISCSVHKSKLATVQCMSCVNLKLPVKESCHCSTDCFLGAWKKHLEFHHRASETVTETKSGDKQSTRKLRSCGSWPDFGNSSFSLDEAVAMVPEGKEWIRVGSSKNYVPSMDDTGSILRLECAAIDCSTGTHLSPTNILVTDPVISFPTRCPRYMFQFGNLLKSRTVQPSDDVKFSVLSYNILSDLYASRDIYSYCPTWALAWEYRRKNLLQEIIEYDADILCLQEVQSDHFESFFKPELTKRGYSVMYKKKTKEPDVFESQAPTPNLMSCCGWTAAFWHRIVPELMPKVYSANQYIIDGCATFYRHDLFKEIMKYELEFDKMALAVVEAMNPGQRKQGNIRLIKDNVALVVILEALKTGSTHDAFQSRICVANTHIHANPKLPDVKLFQVANLVHGLEKICKSQIPLLICGDLNSVPGSDPHKFLVRGQIDSPYMKETDPLDIFRFLKLHHSLPLVSAYASLFSSEGIQEQHLRRMNHSAYEPIFTNFTKEFSETLDYILYTADSLEVEGLLELLDLESLGAGLPSPLWSSDHIALMASFRLKPRQSWRSNSLPLPLNPWKQTATAF